MLFIASSIALHRAASAILVLLHLIAIALCCIIHSSCKDLSSSIQKQRYLDIISFLVRPEIDSIQATGHVILRDPLVRVLSPLSRNPNDFRGASEIYLQPLVAVIVLG